MTRLFFYAMFFCFLILSFSCQKEEFISPINDIETNKSLPSNDVQTVSARSFCQLSAVSAPDYITLATTLFGNSGNGIGGTINNYLQCSPALNLDDCCPPVNNVFLPLGSSYTEIWGSPVPPNVPNFYDYLANGVVTVAEQEQFLARMEQIIATTPPPLCSLGGYNPVSYSIGWSPSFSGANEIYIHLIVNYLPYCFSFSS